MITYELAIEFDITRRIGWTDEDLADHIDEVFDRLHQARGMLSVDGEADLDTGRSTVTLRYRNLVDDEAEHTGRTMLSVAVRSCGGGHRGLLPFSQEASVKPERNQWSGLRIPVWNVRQVTASRVSTEG